MHEFHFKYDLVPHFRSDLHSKHPLRSWFVQMPCGPGAALGALH